jgi:hypothetical protein
MNREDHEPYDHQRWPSRRQYLRASHSDREIDETNYRTNRVFDPARPDIEVVDYDDAEQAETRRHHRRSPEHGERTDGNHRPLRPRP